MRVDLAVPYEEKDAAKALGARWDPREKVWFVPDGIDPAPFNRWLPVDDTPYIYLVFANRTCWSCQKQTEVVGFGIPYSSLYYEDEDEDDCEGADYPGTEMSHADSLAIVNPIGCVPSEIRACIEKRCGYRKVFSKTAQEFQMANTCTSCGRLQGNFMLFEEPDSPLFITDVEDLKKLSFVKVWVGGVYGSPLSWSSFDKLAFEYAEKHHEIFPEKLIEGIYL